VDGTLVVAVLFMLAVVLFVSAAAKSARPVAMTSASAIKERLSMLLLS